MVPSGEEEEERPEVPGHDMTQTRTEITRKHDFCVYFCRYFDCCVDALLYAKLQCSATAAASSLCILANNFF